MATDIFGFYGQNSVNQIGTGFKEPEEAILVGQSGEHKVNLVQNWNIQYQQQVTPIYECGTSTVYFSAKHASGTMTISRIVSENPEQFIKDLGTVCDPQPYTLTAFTGRCGPAGSDAINLQSVKLDIQGMIATSIGFSGQAQQAYVAEDINTMFAALNVSQ